MSNKLFLKGVGFILLAGIMMLSPMNAFAGVEKEMNSDVASNDLKIRVKEALREHKDVTIEVKGEDVILRGHVNTRNEKTILENQIRGVAGVKYVRDEVRVGQSKIDAAEDYVEDAAITAAVKAKNLATKGLDSLDIHVKTSDGVVTLSGKVEKAAQVELAGKVAHEVKGVKRVINNLSIEK